MRKAATSLLAGALFALIAWWPAQGAVTAVFWPRVFDAKGPDYIAIDTLLTDQDQALYPSIRDGPEIGMLSDANCSWRFDIATGLLRDFGSGASLLNTAIHHERNGKNTDLVYATAKAALRDLPNVTLGALQGCVEGSLFAGVCRRYVTQRLVSAMSAHHREIEAKADANDAAATKMACAALDGTRWPPRAK